MGGERGFDRELVVFPVASIAEDGVSEGDIIVKRWMNRISARMVLSIEERRKKEILSSRRGARVDYLIKKRGTRQVEHVIFKL